MYDERYRMSRVKLRRPLRIPSRSDKLSFELSYRPPYDWDALLGFLARRAIEGVEAVDQNVYRRTVNLHHDGAPHAGWMEICPAPRKSAMMVHVSGSLGGGIATVLARARHLLDLACDPLEVARVLGPLATANPGLRVPGAFDGFELAVRAVIGQQVTVAAARTLAGRFAARFGERIATPFDNLTTLFPPPQALVRRRPSTLARLGIIRSRARSIIALARALVRGGLELQPAADIGETVRKLRELPGIGEWTAEYIAMRALACADAFPSKDFGVMKALGTNNSKQVRELSNAWRPWRAYAVMHLWKSLE